MQPAALEGQTLCSGGKPCGCLGRSVNRLGQDGCGGGDKAGIGRGAAGGRGGGSVDLVKAKRRGIARPLAFGRGVAASSSAGIKLKKKKS